MKRQQIKKQFTLNEWLFIFCLLCRLQKKHEELTSYFLGMGWKKVRDVHTGLFFLKILKRLLVTHVWEPENKTK
ncbi:MAG: hypothetical protein CSA32_05585 [Desulfobulbus propionicus]|nr:MAG: hypothetical protein CSA32_05585 [Desulfobulbus propionicus]